LDLTFRKKNKTNIFPIQSEQAGSIKNLLLWLFTDLRTVKRISMSKCAPQRRKKGTKDFHNRISNRIESCVSDICRWMNRNDLKLNEHKIEVVLISSKFRDGPSLDYVNIGNERIPLSDKATSLGVVLDKHMSFGHHIKHLCKSVVCHFRNLFRIRKYLNKESAATVVHAFITSKLDYCNSLFMDYPIIN